MYARGRHPGAKTGSHHETGLSRGATAEASSLSTALIKRDSALANPSILKSHPVPSVTWQTHRASAEPTGRRNGLLLRSGTTQTGRYAVPLTTVWTPPAESGCRSVVQSSSSSYSQPPPGEYIWRNDGYYSPGICPQGYTVGCTAKISVLNGEIITDSETAGICVPRYVLQSPHYLPTLPATGPPGLVFKRGLNSLKCRPWRTNLSRYNCNATQETAISFAVSSVTRASVTHVPLVDVVPAFQIRWRSSDLSCPQTPPITTSAPPPNPSTTNPIPSPPNALSAGAVAVSPSAPSPAPSWFWSASLCSFDAENGTPVASSSPRYRNGAMTPRRVTQSCTVCRAQHRNPPRR